MNSHPKTRPAPFIRFDDRIRNVRRAIRARQPLQTRIDLVRARHSAAVASQADPSTPASASGKALTASEAQQPDRNA